MEVKQVLEGSDYYRCENCINRLDAGLDKITVIDMWSKEVVLCEKCARSLLVKLDKSLNGKEEK